MGVTPEFIDTAREGLGALVKRTYGSTEAPTVTTSAWWDPADKARDTDGHSVGGAALRVVDPVTGRPVPAGVRGEVQVRGPELFVGYGDASQTREAVRRGWFATGDLGVLDDEGWLTIGGRIKELIIRGGENIASAEVERVLEQHPGIRQAVVVGRPDDRFGERVVAFVVADRGGGRRRRAAGGSPTRGWPGSRRRSTWSTWTRSRSSGWASPTARRCAAGPRPWRCPGRAAARTSRSRDPPDRGPRRRPDRPRRLHPAGPAVDGVEVVAVAARDRGRARAFAAKHRIPRVHDSYQELLDDPAIDAVYNPLPNGLHGAWTLAGHGGRQARAVREAVHGQRRRGPGGGGGGRRPGTGW